jgi:hypothetical protein
MRAHALAGGTGGVPAAGAGAGGGCPCLRRAVGALRPGRWLVEVLVTALLVFLAGSAVLGWRSADSQNNFPEALSFAAGPRPAGGYLTMTAAALNIQPPGRQELGLRVRYVGAGQVSSGPFVVSVHPIGASTWAAVARGPDGRCYGTLVTDTGPYGFQTFYAEFPAGTPCKAEIATTSTVTSTTYPE